MNGVFQIYKGNDGQFYWRLKAPNGEILCWSEGYTTKQSAKNGVDACKRYAPLAPVEDLAQAA